MMSPYMGMRAKLGPTIASIPFYSGKNISATDEAGVDIVKTKHICPICKTEFKATGGYVYRRGTKWFCRYNCMRKYDTSRPSGLDKLIQDYQKRLDYLRAQEDLPIEEREIKSGLERLIERVDQRLNTALTRKARKAGLA